MFWLWLWYIFQDFKLHNRFPTEKWICLLQLDPWCSLNFGHALFLVNARLTDWVVIFFFSVGYQCSFMLTFPEMKRLYHYSFWSWHHIQIFISDKSFQNRLIVIIGDSTLNKNKNQPLCVTIYVARWKPLPTEMSFKHRQR